MNENVLPFCGGSVELKINEMGRNGVWMFFVHEMGCRMYIFWIYDVGTVCGEDTQTMRMYVLCTGWRGPRRKCYRQFFNLGAPAIGAQLPVLSDIVHSVSPLAASIFVVIALLWPVLIVPAVFSGC